MTTCLEVNTADVLGGGGGTLLEEAEGICLT